MTPGENLLWAFAEWVADEAYRLRGSSPETAAQFQRWFDWLGALAKHLHRGGPHPGPQPALPYLPTEGLAALGALKLAAHPAALPAKGEEKQP
jgi:hypothetical protein